jgi:hypothetical protein
MMQWSSLAPPRIGVGWLMEERESVGHGMGCVQCNGDVMSFNMYVFGWYIK